MKNLAILLLLGLLSATITTAQDLNVERRTIPVKVLDKKGRPVKNVVLESLHTSGKGMTDPMGMYVFEDIPDNDSISFKLPKYGKTVISVSGMDSIVIKVRTTNSYEMINREKKSVIVEKDNAKSNVVLDVPAILEKQSYNSLIALLRGRVAGLQFTQSATGETAAIRGNSSFVSNNEPLVALDGILVGTISDANSFINIYDIKTIEVVKIASEWGVRGANGVIVITSKRK